MFYQEQNKLLWKVRDDLQKNCSLPELREMLEDNGLDTQGGESSVSEQHWTAWINRGLCVQCFPRLRSAGYSWQPKIFCIMIQRDLSMWSVCFNLGMKFQNHVMIRDNTDVNGIFFYWCGIFVEFKSQTFYFKSGKMGILKKSQWKLKL